MNTIKRIAGRLEMHLARMLAERGATPLIVVGTLSVAAFGAAAVNQPQISQVSPVGAHTAVLNLDSWHTFCYNPDDGSGHTICHILASQVNTIPNLGCSADPDGDGTYICVYATDPRVTQ